MDPIVFAAIFGALVTGVISGCIPLFYGAFKQQLGSGIWGFIICIISAQILGAILAFPVAAICCYMIKKNKL